MFKQKYRKKYIDSEINKVNVNIPKFNKINWSPLPKKSKTKTSTNMDNDANVNIYEWEGSHGEKAAIAIL